MPASYLVRFLPAPISFGPLTALGRGEADAVVNNMGAVQYLVSTPRFKNTIRPPQGVLEPAYMAIALPPGSALKKPLDEALVKSPQARKWRQVEDGYFARRHSYTLICSAPSRHLAITWATARSESFSSHQANDWRCRSLRRSGSADNALTSASRSPQSPIWIAGQPT
jgi:hypothetical protein